MPSTLRTLLLDVDGTLLDSTPLIRGAFEHALAEAGAPYPGWDVVGKLVGEPLGGIYAGIVGHDDVDGLVESHRAFQERTPELAVAFEGAHETLTALKNAGVALAAVTSRSKRTSVRTLELAGLLPLLETVVSPEDVEHLKPDPAPLRLALTRMGRDAAGAVMVGDSSADILAGKALGVPTVAALYGFAGERVLEHRPDAAIRSIRELPATLTQLMDR